MFLVQLPPEQCSQHRCAGSGAIGTRAPVTWPRLVTSLRGGRNSRRLTEIQGTGFKSGTGKDSRAVQKYLGASHQLFCLF